VITHDRWLKPCRSPTIRGSAVATIVDHGGCACVLVTSTSIPTTSSYNFMVTVTITPAVHRHGDRTGRTAGQAGYFNRQNRAPTAAAFGI
jgi:hypothetical protein